MGILTCLSWRLKCLLFSAHQLGEEKSRFLFYAFKELRIALLDDALSESVKRLIISILVDGQQKFLSDISERSQMVGIFIGTCISASDHG